MKSVAINTCGIYKVENVLTGDCYFGQSEHINSRPNSHIKSLAVGKHKNKHLQRAYNKYGGTNFVVTIILRCEKFELTRYEQACVDYMQSTYNQCKICVTSTAGLKHSDETKHNMSVAHVGTIDSEETKHKKSLACIGKNVGKVRSEETKHKLSVSHKGIPNVNKGKTLELTEDQRIALSAVQIGKHTGYKHSEDAKISISNKLTGNKNFEGHTHTEEQKHKIAERMIGNQHAKGHIRTQETIQKFRDTLAKKRLAKKDALS